MPEPDIAVLVRLNAKLDLGEGVFVPFKVKIDRAAEEVEQA